MPDFPLDDLELLLNLTRRFSEHAHHAIVLDEVGSKDRERRQALCVGDEMVPVIARVRANQGAELLHGLEVQPIVALVQSLGASDYSKAAPLWDALSLTITAARAEILADVNAYKDADAQLFALLNEIAATNDGKKYDDRSHEANDRHVSWWYRDYYALLMERQRLALSRPTDILPDPKIVHALRVAVPEADDPSDIEIEIYEFRLQCEANPLAQVPTIKYLAIIDAAIGVKAAWFKLWVPPRTTFPWGSTGNPIPRDDAALKQIINVLCQRDSDLGDHDSVASIYAARLSSARQVENEPANEESKAHPQKWSDISFRQTGRRELDIGMKEGADDWRIVNPDTFGLRQRNGKRNDAQYTALFKLIRAGGTLPTRDLQKHVVSRLRTTLSKHFKIKDDPILCIDRFYEAAFKVAEPAKTKPVGTDSLDDEKGQARVDALEAKKYSAKERESNFS